VWLPLHLPSLFPGSYPKPECGQYVTRILAKPALIDKVLLGLYSMVSTTMDLKPNSLHQMQEIQPLPPPQQLQVVSMLLFLLQSPQNKDLVLTTPDFLVETQRLLPLLQVL
jgi:hypothetical protein